LQRCCQCPESYLLFSGCRLPEAGKGLGHIILLAIKAAGNLSEGMTAHPTKHYLTEALLHSFPSKGITLLQSTTEEFHTVLIIARLTAPVVV
jgi:hypothetical protein